MADKWYSNILKSFSKDDVEFKSLKRDLESKLTELQEAMDYEVKFLDNEPTSFSPMGSSEYPGIEQQLDATALQRLYTTETWIYSPVSEIAKTVASLPLKLTKKQTVVKPIKNEVTGVEENVKQDVYVEATGDKLADIFNFPNQFATKTEFLTLLVIDLMICGEYFIYIDSDDNIEGLDSNEDPNSPFGRLARAMSQGITIKGIYRLPPPMMKPVISKDRLKIEGYAQQTTSGMHAYAPEEIIHVKLPNPIDMFRGLSPLIPAFKPVLLDRFSTEHMVRFYKTGARLGGVIETEKSLNKEQLGRFQRSFESNFTGRKNHHRTLILPPGMKYTTIEQNPAETALLEFCKYNREAILSVYHVPPIKVGVMDGANYANALVQLKIFFTDTVKPILSFIEDGFNLKSSLLPANYKVQFDLSDVEALKEDYQAMATMAQGMIKAGLTVDEVRKMVWKKEPLAKGDRAYSIAEIDRLEAQGKGKEDGGFLNLAAPTQGVQNKAEDDYDVSAVSGQEGFADLDGPQTTAVMNILGRLARGKINPDQAVELMVMAYGIPREQACKLAGVEPPKKEKTGKENLIDFISDSLSKLDDSETITPEFLSELLSIHNSQNVQKEIPVTTAPTQQDIVEQPTVYGFGLSKDHVVEHWKSFISKTDPMVEKRKAEINKWFKSVKSLILNRLGANVKAYGLYKVKSNDDVEEILDESSFDELLKSYVVDIDATLKTAFEMGYTDTLANVVFDAPNKQASEFLKQYGAKEVKHILDTTRDQMKAVLSKAFDEKVSIAEVSARIQEKFNEIEQGRANTIARTETLTAVSKGQQQKRADFKEKFPQKKLKKLWVSAQDERVRDSHQELDGESVDEDSEFSNGLKYPREAGGEPEEVINCFYRSDYRIYTSKGWKMIKDIVPGDMVLTHSGEFKPVERTLNDKIVKGSGSKIRIDYEIDGIESFIECTPEHRFLTQRGWVQAKDLTEDDSIKSYTPECSVCGKISKIDNMNSYSCCSKSCLSKAITKRQWSDPVHKANMSSKTSAQLNKEYANGTRDRFEITKKANIKMRQLGDAGKCLWPNRRKGNNHWARLEPKRHSEAVAKGFRRSKKGSKDENDFGKWLESLGFSPKRQVVFGRYRVDFLIGNKVIEFNGDYWHLLPGVKEKDKKRKSILQNEYGLEVMEIWASEFRYKYKRKNIKNKILTYLSQENANV